LLVELLADVCAVVGDVQPFTNLSVELLLAGVVLVDVILEQDSDDKEEHDLDEVALLHREQVDLVDVLVGTHLVKVEWLIKHVLAFIVFIVTQLALCQYIVAGRAGEEGATRIDV